MKKIRFTLRISDVLNKKLEELSKKEELTKNALIVSILREKVGQLGQR